MTVLASADALPAGARLLDVRWQLGGPPGRDQYLAGHLPGAVFVDLETELAGHDAPEEGRHPLPGLRELQGAARRWGLRDGDRVVVYDDAGGTAAARAWWLLRWGGVRDVRILDGGLAAWVRAGGELETGDVVPRPGDIELTGGGMAVLDAEGAARAASDGVLLDARAAERFRGETEPVDPVAGHIPGARSAPATGNLADDGTFLAPSALRERYEALGVAEGVAIGAYCGSGITAAHDVAALQIAGYDAALYPGSWSAWITEPARAVATGEG